MKTHQETFNIVYKNLKIQNCFSIGSNGLCAYRGENGAKCAVGHLISDHLYNDELEGVICWDNFDEPNECDDKIKKIMQILYEEGHDPEFVRELQKIHDRNSKYDSPHDDWSAWESDMLNLAEEYNIVIED